MIDLSNALWFSSRDTGKLYVLYESECYYLFGKGIRKYTSMGSWIRTKNFIKAKLSCLRSCRTHVGQCDHLNCFIHKPWQTLVVLIISLLKIFLFSTDHNMAWVPLYLNSSVRSIVYQWRLLHEICTLFNPPQ